MTAPARYAPRLPEAVVLDRAAAFAAEGNQDHPLLLITSHPEWSGPVVLERNGSAVRILATQSPLEILAVLHARRDELLVVLTDRTLHELGSAIALRARRQRLETLDEWSVVPGLFGALTIDRTLSALGSWFPRMAIEWRPATGWPRVPAGLLTAEFGVNALVSRLLELSPGDVLDPALLLERLDVPSVRQTWRSLDQSSRTELTRAAEQLITPAAPVLFSAVMSGTSVSVIAIGLALDVLWPDGGRAPVAEQIAARTRIEQLLGPKLEYRAVRELADASIAILLRWELLGDSVVPHILNQAEALLADYGWAAGATHSALLPAGITARVRAVAEAAATIRPDSSAEDLAAMEAELTRLGEHLIVQRQHSDQLAAQMAVRLARWTRRAEPERPETFAAGVVAYGADGAWVDRALSVLWDGSTDEATSHAFAALAGHVRERRRASELALAPLISAEDVNTPEAFGIERLWERVVAPLAAAAPVLLVVLDGMSAAVATELDTEIVAAGWREAVPAATGRRLVSVATIPTVTKFSRASLFSGELASGGQDVEKVAFSSRSTGRLFHKDDLRSGDGMTLPQPVLDSVADATQKIVGVVLNTIDDALAKHDPGGTRWDLPHVQHLRPLLAAAGNSGRIVVFTSDHGHVIERGGEHRSTTNAAARWRLPETGPVGEGELDLTGPRVRAPGGRVIVARDEGLRYTAKAAGYHGGVSLAELTIPVHVYHQPQTPLPADWADGIPAAPPWWNERVRVVAPAVAPRAPRKPVVDPAQPQFELDLGVDLVAAETPSSNSLATLLLASRLYDAQKARAGRHPLDDSVVSAVLVALENGGGRAHRDTIAAAARVPAAKVDNTLAALRRLLNVDAYDVIRSDADGVTIHLDAPLLREQFGLGGAG